MIETDFLRPDAMPICLEQTLFLLMIVEDSGWEDIKLRWF